VLDYIIDGSDVMSVAGGDAIMTRVTGFRVGGVEV
jgi:hydroxyethylthiazole kinase-like sugar kinase family protein